MLVWEWLIDPHNGSVISAIGFVIGIVGFALTIAGFSVGLYRLREIEIASIAARKAVDGFKLRVGNYDASQDTLRADTVLDTLADHIDSQRWREVEQSYNQVLVMTINIAPILTTDDADMFNDIIIMNKSINKLLFQIDNHLSDPTKPRPNPATVKLMARGHKATVKKLHILLQDRAI